MSYQFDRFEMDVQNYRLLKDGAEVDLEPKVFDLLSYLVEHRDRLVTRDELFENIWAGQVVSEATLSNQIKAARRALDDDGKRQACIQTVHGRGYRFVADVRDEATDQAGIQRDDADNQNTSPPAPSPTETVEPRILRSGKPSLAIKPFEDIGADAESNRLADAFSNGIAVALTRLPSLVMINDESPSMIETKQLTVQEISERLRARYVLKGVVQSFGGQIRVSAELVDTSNQRYLWADNIDGKLQDVGDIFRIQDDIVDEIVTALNVKLLAGEAARIVRKALKDPVALERYYRGEELLWHSSMKLELQEAHRLFEETIELEPESPVGYAAAALTHWVEAISGLTDSPEESLAKATDLAQQAIRLNDVTGYAHMVLAHVHLTRREFDEAMAEATQAVTYRPSCPASYAIKASVMTYLDQASEAVEFAEYALQLTPVHPPMYPAVLASACYGCRRYEQAIAAAKRAIDLSGRDASPRVFWAASAAALGHMDEAGTVADELMQIDGNFNLADFAKSQPYKRKDTLDQLIDRLKAAGLS